MLSFTHLYQPPRAPGAPTLLMLHGTGGNEHELVPLAAELMPGAGVLSPRGKVLERGMPRFFRRLAEGVFDLDDLRQRTLELADFIGLDTCLSVMQVLYEGLADSKYRPCPLLVKYVEAGWLGRKTQRGFYDYRGEKPVPTR